MKKSISRLLFLPFFVVSMLSTAVIAQQRLEATGQGKVNIAVINLKNSAGVAAGESELISDRLRGDLFNTGKVNVMERDQMQEILKEQGFQASGACNDESCLVQMGQLLGVQSLVTGSIGKVGSMFLVNVRMIDVKTAKIVKVVSVDIRGEIEDVVGKLKDIAEQLVGSATEPRKAPEPIAEIKTEKPKVERMKEEKIAPEPQKKEMVAVGHQKDEQKAVGIPEDKQMRMNKNRSGLQLNMNFYLGRMKEQGHWVYYDFDGSKISDEKIGLDSLYPPFSHSGFFNLQLIFAIKVGSMFTIDVGTGFISGTATYGPIYDNKPTYENDLTAFSVNTGFNYVKRWYPFKLTIGVTIDGNVLVYSENYQITDTYGFTTDTSVVSVGFNGSFGLKIGGEYLIGEHFGIGGDIRFCRSHFETVAENYAADASASYSDFDFSRIIDFPPLGLGVGFHYYF